MKFFQTIAFSVPIAFLACMVNGLLCGGYGLVFAVEETSGSIFLLVVFCTAMFGAPGVLLFWLCFFVWVLNGKKGQALFRTLVLLAVGIALLGSGFFCWLMHRDLPLPIPVAMLSALIAAVVSLFLHRSFIISLYQPAKKLSYV